MPYFSQAQRGSPRPAEVEQGNFGVVSQSLAQLGTTALNVWQAAKAEEKNDIDTGLSAFNSKWTADLTNEFARSKTNGEDILKSFNERYDTETENVASQLEDPKMAEYYRVRAAAIKGNLSVYATKQAAEASLRLWAENNNDALSNYSSTVFNDPNQINTALESYRSQVGNASGLVDGASLAKATFGGERDIVMSAVRGGIYGPNSNLVAAKGVIMSDAFNKYISASDKVTILNEIRGVENGRIQDAMTQQNWEDKQRDKASDDAIENYKFESLEKGALPSVNDIINMRNEGKVTTKKANAAIEYINKNNANFDTMSFERTSTALNNVVNKGMTGEDAFKAISSIPVVGQGNLPAVAKSVIDATSETRTTPEDIVSQNELKRVLPLVINGQGVSSASIDSLNKLTLADRSLLKSFSREMPAGLTKQEGYGDYLSYSNLQDKIVSGRINSQAGLQADPEFARIGIRGQQTLSKYLIDEISPSAENKILGSSRKNVISIAKPFFGGLDLQPGMAITPDMMDTNRMAAYRTAVFTEAVRGEERRLLDAGKSYFEVDDILYNPKSPGYVGKASVLNKFKTLSMGEEGRPAIAVTPVSTSDISNAPVTPTPSVNRKPLDSIFGGK